jgi:hypothetical protein
MRGFFVFNLSLCSLVFQTSRFFFYFYFDFKEFMTPMVLHNPNLRIGTGE